MGLKHRAGLLIFSVKLTFLSSLAAAKSHHGDERKTKATLALKKRKRILDSSDESECERVMKRRKIDLASTDDEL